MAETTAHLADILGQIFNGFGVAESYRADSVREASGLLKHKAFDLILIDPDVEGAGARVEGLEGLRNLTARHVESMLIDELST